MKETYYVRIEGFCDACLGVYSVEAENEEEAIKKAKEDYLSNLDFSLTDREDYEEENDLERNAEEVEDFIDDIIEEGNSDLTYFEFREMAEDVGLDVDMSDWHEYQKRLNIEEEE